jgi:Xaa-Pro aminopeptidase
VLVEVNSLRDDLDDVLAEKEAGALLLYSESFKNANMYYLTKFLAPDPFIFLKKVDSDPVIVINQMEYPRAQKESIVKDVRSYTDYTFVEVMKSAEEPRLGNMKFIATVAKKEFGTNMRICVPSNFPVMAADVLRKEGLTIEPIFDVIEKVRETKDTYEIDEIKSVQALAEKVMAEAIDLIANAETDMKKSLFIEKDGKKKLLTVGKVKSLFGHKFLDQDCIAEEGTIVACGSKGSDPHYFGDPRDKFKANQLIVIDVYPRSIQRRYWTDMTRTIVKGKAPEKVKKMFDTLLEAKDASMDALQAGAHGNDIYSLCCDVLEKVGYETTRQGKQIKRGFTHSLGHGVGLELHEGPNLNEFYKLPLKEHSIITVEPGLYDPDIGGMRIEDIVEVKKRRCNNLTNMETILEV